MRLNYSRRCGAEFSKPAAWVFALLVSFLLAGAARAQQPRERLLMDAGWKFHLGNDENWGTGEALDKVGTSVGPAAAWNARHNFDDSGWRTVDLPHDWVVELPFDQKADTFHGFKPVGPGFPQNSIGWYRRAFALPKTDAGRRLWLEFDGVYRDCRVFLNGYFIGHHESGYSSFRFDITDVANAGGTNVLAVRVDASQFEGWFYEGAGIYRHVWLVKTGPVAIAPDGTFVYSEFKNNLPTGSAKIEINTELGNWLRAATDAKVKCEIIGPDGKVAARTEKSAKLNAWSAAVVHQEASVSSPELWSPETPALYRLVTTIESGGKVADRTETEFGIRTVAFDANRGFLLNGKPYEIKGMCNHQDHAGVGSAIPDALQYFRVQRLKDMGCNADRTAHNPPTPEFLEACDHLGLLVMDENRQLNSDAANLARLEGQVKRDRNHPSVFVWSLGNEEYAIHATPASARITERMQSLVHRLDPTREATYAANEGNVFTGVNGVIDVRGWNYHLGTPMDRYHAAHPDQPEIGTEQASTLATRGIYANDAKAGYMSAYDDNAPSWGNTAEQWWPFFAARPWLSGGFVWTGFDYRGEPTPYAWPCVNCHFGVMDTCGFAKDDFYYYQAWWTDQPMVHLLPHWNWSGHEGQGIDVRCFSNCGEVELFLNGRSLGRKTMPKNSHLQWTVKYEPGTLLAKGYQNGVAVAEDKVETTDAPAAVKLTPNRTVINADGEDVSVVTVAVTDGQGRVVPVAGNLVKFELSGPGRILGVGNGDPSSHEADYYPGARPVVESMEVGGWRMLKVPNTNSRPEVAASFDDSNWTAVDVNASEGPLIAGEDAVFRTRVTLNAAQAAGTNTTVTFGSLDDEGLVYVNGQFVGDTHNWSDAATFEIHNLLHEGGNTIAVVIENGYSTGGVNHGVKMEFVSTAPAEEWKRSVFNGLAQVLVQAGGDAGEIRLTAHADGLADATAVIAAQPHTPRPAVP